MDEMPPGYRFYPTEEELVSFYLHNKLQGRRQDLDRVIPVLDICEFDPWDLPQFAGALCHGDPEQWFFFIPRQEKEARGGRPNRLTTAGYWKATGSPGYVYSSGNRVIGMKRTMVFYRGRAPTGRKTKWEMNEYRAIEGEASSSTSTAPKVERYAGDPTFLVRIYIRTHKHSVSRVAEGSLDEAKCSRDLEEETVVLLPQFSMAMASTTSVEANDATKLLERLTGIKKQLEVISIVGMAGLGKTTLARKVYDDPFIVNYFYIRAWTHVSQVYHKRDLLLDILSSVIELTDEVSEMSTEKLSEQLRKRLIGHRYLIVIDDIWDIEVWHDLKRSFPDNKIGSKIMFTSRLANLHSQAQPDSHPYSLRFLPEDESWILLQQKVFQNELCPPELIEPGKQIAKKCQGLPLAIVVIAGFLANDKIPNWWSKVAECVSSHIVSDPQQYMETLALSYNHLPNHLKPCFLYLGAFPEDHEIPVCKLIWLWVAEGFIHQTGRKRLEDVAEDYLMDLITRNLVIVAKKGSNGGIKSCIIHDLLRDLCLRKSKEEGFLQQLKNYEPNSSSSSPFTNKPCRLCIDSPSFNNFCLMPFTPCVKSLLCFSAVEPKIFFEECASFIYHAFKLLRVLDLSTIKIPFFSSEILQLVDLRYLALKAEFGSPPTSISKLQYLETLIISSRTNIVVPKNIWKIVKLRHLYISLGVNNIEDPCFEEEQTNVGYPSLLENLQTLSLVCPSRSCQDVLARAPNLRKLGFCGPLISESRDLTFPDLGSFDHIETLKLFNTAFYNEAARSCNPYKFPDRLKRLTLTSTALEWNEMWTIGMLPNLEVLKLKLHACIGREWETSGGGFCRLKFLKFQDLDIVQWNASSDHFPALQQLVLHGCRELEEIPSSLGDIFTLEMIEVSWCSYSAAKSARKIKADQEDKGNDCLKIFTREQGMITPKILTLVQ